MNKKPIIGIFSVIFASSAIAEEGSSGQDVKPPRVDRIEKKAPKGPGHHKRPPHGGPGEMFKRMDRDGDGDITKEEFFSGPRLEQLEGEKRQMIFARLDLNSDGVIDRAEIRKIRRDGEDKRKRELRSLDKDGSGGLSFEEFSKGEFFGRLPEDKRRQIFKRMDTDGSGEINADDKPPGPPRGKKRREDKPEKGSED